jgi:hypothetical protein
MRLWSLHPRYLDVQGLTACWRESLLAQKVLSGTTVGYRNHPQLRRFRTQPEAIGDYLRGIADEADVRGYRFRRELITARRGRTRLTVTEGQLDYEWQGLYERMSLRSPQWSARFDRGLLPEPHPLFRVIPGPIEQWEVAAFR